MAVVVDRVFESLLIHTCTVQKPVTTTGQYKNTSTSYSNRNTSVKCRATPVSGRLEDAQMAALYEAEWIFEFLPTQTIARGDQILYNDETYFVKHVSPFSDGRDLHHNKVFAGIRDIT